MMVSSRWEWLDFDENESQQVRDFLSQDVEGEGVDPLRIGASVRDHIAEKLFPGTSTQYTRLRYVILVPAILRTNGGTLDNLSNSQSLLNVAIDRANRQETGIIGRRSPKRDFVRLYWTAVRTWGFLTSTDPRDITVANGLAALQEKTATDEEGNPIAESRVRWLPEIVRLADQFWSGKKHDQWPSIRCNSAEADFILRQWTTLPANPPLSVIPEYVRRGRRLSRAAYPWDMALDNSNRDARTKLDDAKIVSLICWGVQLAYNFALLSAARRLEAQGEDTAWTQRNQDLRKTEDKIDSLYQAWQVAFDAEGTAVSPWSDAAHWDFVTSDATRSFLAGAAKMLATGKTDLRLTDWSHWVAEREKKINPGAKLTNCHHLATWSGTPEMAQRWDFRWKSCVRRFVSDLEDARE